MTSHSWRTITGAFISALGTTANDSNIAPLSSEYSDASGNGAANAIKLVNTVKVQCTANTVFVRVNATATNAAFDGACTPGSPVIVPIAPGQFVSVIASAANTPTTIEFGHSYRA